MRFGGAAQAAAAPSAVAASGLRRLRPGVEMRLSVAVRGESA